jgi:hypothetical protein
MRALRLDHAGDYRRYGGANHVAVLDVHAAVMPVPPTGTAAGLVRAALRLRVPGIARPDPTADGATANFAMVAQAFLVRMRRRYFFAAVSRSCLACAASPAGVSLFPCMYPRWFSVPYTALGLFGYSFLSLSSRNLGIRAFVRFAPSWSTGASKREPITGWCAYLQTLLPFEGG